MIRCPDRGELVLRLRPIVNDLRYLLRGVKTSAGGIDHVEREPFVDDQVRDLVEDLSRVGLTVIVVDGDGR